MPIQYLSADRGEGFWLNVSTLTNSINPKDRYLTRNGYTTTSSGAYGPGLLFDPSQVYPASLQYTPYVKFDSGRNYINSSKSFTLYCTVVPGTFTATAPATSTTYLIKLYNKTTPANLTAIQYLHRANAAGADPTSYLACFNRGSATPEVINISGFSIGTAISIVYYVYQTSGQLGTNVTSYELYVNGSLATSGTDTLTSGTDSVRNVIEIGSDTSFAANNGPKFSIHNIGVLTRSFTGTELQTLSTAVGAQVIATELAQGVPQLIKKRMLGSVIDPGKYVALTGQRATFDYNNRLVRYPRTITFELQK